MTKYLSVILLLLFLGFGGSFSAQSSFVENHSQKFEDVIIAYPNPTKDYISIRSTQAGVRVKSVVFYDILGTQVAVFSANSTSLEVDLSRLKPGKYLMRSILSDNTQRVKQIIKQ